MRWEALTPSPTTSDCAYKGHARYWSLASGDPDGADIGWSYEDPLSDGERVRGYVAFWCERTDLTLDGVQMPRPESLFFPRGRR
ncbi:DUF427 domain-containing protein [Oerskovia sp. KBS0722]|uniref:DUF427 domain-containing protein n=1 Tax=Oerskovia sp. KBS0722 TaxID=1179673 RepID=UPI00143D0D39|nr:DUF427 domain-containing protein [Oerskovia sp. KBS0722]